MNEPELPIFILTVKLKPLFDQSLDQTKREIEDALRDLEDYKIEWVAISR